ncbi:hypothetical protein ACJJTC_014313 [Scirpophaga incertulas]
MYHFQRVIYTSLIILCVIVKVCLKDIAVVPGWFKPRSVERNVISNSKYRMSEFPIDNDIEDKVQRKKRNKIKHRKFKKIRKSLTGSPNADVFEVEEVKSKKKKKAKKKYFTKAMTNNVDSNLSDSHEKKQHRKPVDIIVHIKMNE